MYCFFSLLTILLFQAESKCALVYGQMNEPPGARARVGLTGLTVAEHFRDAEGQDVLLFIDNIFRFTQVYKLIMTILSIIFYFSCGEINNGRNLSSSRQFCRPTLRCLPCLVVSRLLSVTNQLWLPILEACKNVSQPPRRVPLLLSKLFMCLLMT